MALINEEPEAHGPADRLAMARRRQVGWGGRSNVAVTDHAGKPSALIRSSDEPHGGRDGRVHGAMVRDQRTFTYDTVKEARAERARIISESAKGTYVKPAKTTVEAWLGEWLAAKERSVKPTTHRHYVDVLRPVRERFGHVELQRLGERDLEALVADMRSGAARRRGSKGKPLSGRSVHAMLTALGVALTVAMKRQLVVRNIVETVERDRRPAARRRP